MARNKPGARGKKDDRDAFCSFCRKSHRDVGPLVEGPGDAYICGECVELCQSIIDQEKRRRNPELTAGNLEPALVHFFRGQGRRRNL